MDRIRRPAARCRQCARVLLAATDAGGCSTGRVEKLIPYLVQDENQVPGIPTWYASTCRQCAAGCGILVRVINGRAKKIEGNPLHPLNRGKLCARGQAGLQGLYNPDRLKNAVRQIGGRGLRKFEPLYWDDALKILTEKISGLSDPSRLAFFGGLMPDHLYQLTTRLLTALGAPPPVIFDLHAALEGRVTATQLSQTFFGAPELPIYDLAHSQVVLSFGANLLETWMSPVAQSYAYGALRQGYHGGRGYIAQFEPRLSATAASADEWIPVRPGNEGLVALAIGRLIIEGGLGHVGSHRAYAGLYQNVDVREMANASEVSVETLQRLAQVFAAADQAVAIPGGYPAGQSNGLASLSAVQALNLLVAQVGRVGGVFLSHPGSTEALRQTPPVDSFDHVQDLIKRMKAGQIDLLMIHGANPVFELPAAAGFASLSAFSPLFGFPLAPCLGENYGAAVTDLIDGCSHLSFRFCRPRRLRRCGCRRSCNGENTNAHDRMSSGGRR